MHIGTLVYPLREEHGHLQVCLARKKRTLGIGLWNGYGGKCEFSDGQSIVACASREAEEESGVRVLEKDLDGRAVITVYHGKVPFFMVYVFTTLHWEGSPYETSEMGPPKWFDITKLPLSEMFPDDKVWFPRLLKGERFIARAHLSEDGETLLSVTFGGDVQKAFSKRVIPGP